MDLEGKGLAFSIIKILIISSEFFIDTTFFKAFHLKMLSSSKFLMIPFLLGILSRNLEGRKFICPTRQSFSKTLIDEAVNKEPEIADEIASYDKVMIIMRKVRC